MVLLGQWLQVHLFFNLFLSPIFVSFAKKVKSSVLTAQPFFLFFLVTKESIFPSVNYLPPPAHPPLPWPSPSLPVAANPQAHCQAVRLDSGGWAAV